MAEALPENTTEQDVYELLDAAGQVDGFDQPTGEAFWLRFSVSGYDLMDTDLDGNKYSGDYRFEVNYLSGNLWLHKEAGTGTETIWKNKRSRY